MNDEVRRLLEPLRATRCEVEDRGLRAYESWRDRMVNRELVERQGHLWMVAQVKAARSSQDAGLVVSVELVRLSRSRSLDERTVRHSHDALGLHAHRVLTSGRLGPVLAEEAER